jgi:N-acetylglucosaminyldiphosphoundecaprenol N-acetyl-beta-D-mannosaminyltransferase
MIRQPLPSTKLLGVKLTLCDKSELLGSIENWIRDGERAIVLSGNVHAFNLAYGHPWLRQFMNRADVVRLDGAGLRLGARILGASTPPRMTWADFAWDLAGFVESRGFACFFLGARPGVAEKAAARLKERFPGISIVGTHHGYFDRSPGSPENEALIGQINAARPDILIVGFGMPLQEQWLRENWERIDANVVFTGGAVFDYISGELDRAPGWMRDRGLEWLGRLAIEPRRLWRRYLIGNPLFLWRVLKQRLGLLRSAGRSFAARREDDWAG